MGFLEGVLLAPKTRMIIDKKNVLISAYLGQLVLGLCFTYLNSIIYVNVKSNEKVSVYEQEIPQSHTEDQPLEPQGRVTDY